MAPRHPMWAAFCRAPSIVRKRYMSSARAASGQVKRADSMFLPDGTPRGVRQVGVQEVDIISIVRPLTKYAVTVNDPQTIRYRLRQASELFGDALTDPDTRFRLLLALRVHRLLGSA